jgi:hypothetical protein
MKNRFAWAGRLALLGLLVGGPIAQAAPNLRSLVPFAKKVEADPQKTYEVTEEHGPWMIMATSFSGIGAEEQAQELVLELRKSFNLEAYQHRRTFDFTEPVIGHGLTPQGEPKKMRYRQNVRFDEIAVLVGHYARPDASEIESTLYKVKYARPNCLDLSKRSQSSQRFAGLRAIQRRIHPNPEKRQRGPMGNAFVTRNPLLPEEFFVAPGLDSLVLEMNQGVEHSLLDCPAKYTVKVATFRGEMTMDLSKMEAQPKLFRTQPTKLEQAAEKAHLLTKALRAKGVEAYEFHDRFESIVTVGSFQSVGSPRDDGKIEIDPAVHAIIETYRAEKQPLGTMVGLKPQTLNGIAFDIQPQPVEVPRTESPPVYRPTLGTGGANGRVSLR